MAKRKRKVELIEKTLEQELEQEIESEQVIDTVAASAEVSKVIEPTHLHKSKTTTDKIPFIGRSYVESRFPQSVRWADRFAHDWRTQGSFDFISHPVAKDMVLIGVKKIRAAEKRLESNYTKTIGPLTQQALKKVEKVVQRFR